MQALHQNTMPRRTLQYNCLNPFSLLSLSVIFVLFTTSSLAQLLPNRYILTLQDQPVTTRFTARAEMQGAQAAAYRTQIEARQAAIKSNLAARIISVTGSVSVLQNLIFVAAPASRVAEMQSIPGVVSVRPMRRFKPTLNAATQLLNAPAAWTTVGGWNQDRHPRFRDRSEPPGVSGLFTSHAGRISEMHQRASRGLRLHE
jgi:hypothetical protein